MSTDPISTAPRATSLDGAARFALPALLLGAIALGLSGTWVKLAETGPISTAFYRLAIAAPLFLLYLQAAPSEAANRRGVTGRDWALLALAGFFFAADIAVWNFALNHTSVANGALIGNMASIFVTLGAWLFLGERITPIFLAGMALAITGAGILFGDGLSLDPNQWKGDLLAIAAAILFAAYILIVARLRAHLSTATIMTWSTLAGALALLPAALAFDDTIVAVTWVGWVAVIGLGLVSHVAGQGMVTFALAHLPASFSSVAMLVMPVAAAVFAWIILGEAIGPWQALGGAVVIGGILVARRGTPIAIGARRPR